MSDEPWGVEEAKLNALCEICNRLIDLVYEMRELRFVLCLATDQKIRPAPQTEKSCAEP